MIRIRLLGPPEIDGDGGPPIRWRKNMALLAYLVRAGGKSVSRDHLIGLLWAEKDEGAARHSLREALRVIRKGAGDSLVVEGDRVRLEEPGIESDVAQFEEFERGSRFGDAWPLIRGEFMEGFGVPDCSEFENWMTSERILWMRRATDVATRLARAYIGSGDLSAALRVVGDQPGIDRDSEELARLSMTAHSLNGSRALALKAFGELRERLSEIGTQPDRETVALAERIRSGRVTEVGNRIRSSVSVARRLPLVGRAAPLNAALDFLDNARSEGASAAVVLSGDPGSGKSRFGGEIVERQRLLGADVSTVRGVGSDLNEPWSGIYGLCRGGLLDCAGVNGADPDALAVIGQDVVEWQDRFRTSAPKGAMSVGRAFEEIVRAALEEAPLLLWLDDAHLLDEESLGAVCGLVSKLGESPLCVLLSEPVGSHRAELDELRSRAGREVRGKVVNLEPLDAPALASLVKEVLPEFSDPEVKRLSRRLLEDTAGLPVLAVEILNAIAHGLELGGIDRSWPAPFKTLTETMPGDLPDAIVASIRIGFRILSAPAQEVLTIVALADRPVPFDLLRKVSPLGERELADAADEAEWCRWLSADARGYSYVARIVKDVVATDLVSAGKAARLRAQFSGSSDSVSGASP